MSFEEYREKLSQGCTQLVPLGRPNSSRSSLPTSHASKNPVQLKEFKTATTELTRPPSPPRLNMSVGPSLTTQRSPHPVPREVQINSSGSIPPHHPPRITSKGWSVPDLCRRYESFQEVRRVSALSSPEVIAKALEEYEQDGLPLIISDWHKHPKWPQDIFNLEWLIRTSGNTEIHVRNLHNREDQSMTLSEFVKKSQSQTQYTVPGETERLYWKDADCPPEWKDWLLRSGAIPTSVLPASPDDYLGYLLPSEAVESLLCYMGIGDTYTASHKDLCASSGHNLMCFSEENASSFWFMTASNDAPRIAEYFQRKLKQELDWETHVTTVEELGNAPTTVYVAEQKVGDLVLVPSRSCHQVVNSGGLAMKTSWSRMTLDNLDKALHCELPVYRRVCRPEQYRVKTILYRSMLHLTKVLEKDFAELQANNHRERTSVSVDEEIVAGLCNNPAMSELAGYNSPSPEPDSSAPSPEQSTKKLAECGRKLRQLVELFDEVLREEYSSTHAEMEHMVSYESSAGWKVADGSAADDSCAGSSSSSGGRLILCPPADQLKRQEEHYERSRNMSYTLACDFCGADIFQSFFECNHCRRPEAGSEPQVGDGLLICPGCYVEGRSCHCDRLEPIQCRPFDTLLLDRNVAAKVLSCVLPSEEHLKTLEESHIVLKSNSCVFEAACTLYLLRKQRHEKPEKNSRKCRVKHANSHEMYFDEGLNCSTCHSSTCFRHLLAKGTHAVQAILKHSIGDAKSKVYHDTHKANAAALERSTKKTHVELDQLRHVHERMLFAALSFPKCRPGHPKVKLGWYDRENTIVVAAGQTTATPAKEDVRVAGETRAHEPISEPSSPLTPVESDIESLFDDASLREEGQLHGSLPKQPESAVTIPSGDDHLVIELTSSESEPPSPVMSAAHCYVKMPPLPSYASHLKRAASLSGLSSASRKKPRETDVDDPDELTHTLNVVGKTRRPKHSHVMPGAARVREDSSMEDESNTVAMDLVRALSLANSEAPIYSKRSGQGRMRVIESDIEEMSTSPPHMDDSSHPRDETRTSSAVRLRPPVASGLAQPDTYSGARPPLPRTSTLKRPRAEEPLDTREQRVLPRHASDVSVPAKNSALTASDRPPKKRKGPPGLSQEEMARQTSAQQQLMRMEETARPGPEQRKKTYSKGDHSVVKRPSARDVEAPARRVTRADPPSFPPSENSFARPSASAQEQQFDEQNNDMITFGSTNDDVPRTSTAATAVTIPLLSATEGSGTSQAVVAISGASDSSHVPASVSIRASVSASAGTPTSLFGQPPPALPMSTISARETHHPQPSRSVPLLTMLKSHNQADVTFGTLFESIRHLAAAGLATEQQEQKFEVALQSLQGEVRTLLQRRFALEEELGSVKERLGSVEEQLRTVSGKLHADRAERGRQAAVIRDLQQKYDKLEAGFSDRVREVVAPMITAHLQQTQYAHSAPPGPAPATIGMPGPSHEYQHSGYGQGGSLPSGGHDVRQQPWDNSMGPRYSGPQAGFNAQSNCPPHDPYTAPPGQFNGRGQDGHFRGRGYGSGEGQGQGPGRHQSNGFPPRGPANGGGDHWNSRQRNDQGSQGGMGPRQNNHAPPAQPWQGRPAGGYREDRGGYSQRRGSDDTRGWPYDERRGPRRSMSRGGNDRRRSSRPPDAPRSESSEHTLRRDTPPSTMESPTDLQQPTRGRSPGDRLPERDATPLLDIADSRERVFLSPPGGFQ